MIGIFDSGVGGICAYREVRRRLRQEDIIYLADRENAPYGTKSKDELVALTIKDIQRLREVGVRKILIACCTASSIHRLLPADMQSISLPIISPSAKTASAFGRIAVIATEHTARSHAFKDEIAGLSDSCVFEFAHQELVSFVEKRSKEGCRESLQRIKREVEEARADCLILGCTHFSHLEGELRELLPHINIVSPAREGAIALIKSLESELHESGRVIYT